jgi:AraC-like DNA-binding protein
MKIKVLVIEIGIKNIGSLKKSFKVRNAEIIYASSFLDIVDIIHLDKVHVIIFSNFRGQKSTVGYIKMFKTTNPAFKLIVLSNDKEPLEEEEFFYIGRGADGFVSSFDIAKLAAFFQKRESSSDDGLISEKWSKCTAKAIRCIKNNFHTQGDLLKIVSEITNYSISSISHAVKKDTGESFSEWVQKLRVKGAVELLKSTEYSIKKVSDRVGYKSAQGLIKAFKKTLGKTPASYRE